MLLLRHLKDFPLSPSATVFIASAIVAMISGCTSFTPRPTQAEVDQANQICTIQLAGDKAIRNRKWFTRWLACKQEHIMPLEIRLYPTKEAPIRKMYDRLFTLGIAVDAGWTGAEPVYDEWDRMQAEIGMYRGVCVKNSDGSQRCIKPTRSGVYIHTKSGDVIPYE